MCFFKTQDLNLGADDESSTLTATTKDGDDIMSTDSVKIVPAKVEK